MKKEVRKIKIIIKKKGYDKGNEEGMMGEKKRKEI